MPRPSRLEWVCLALGLALVWRYRFLYDDAFVYFRYVDNALFMDLGLVYNQGEFVEGYTSPLWTLLLLAARATGLAWPVVIAGLALLGFALLWLLLVQLGRRAAPPDGPHLNLPLAFLAPCYSVASWQCSGMEVALLQIAAPCFALFVLRPRSLPLQVAVALAPLVRHELALALGVAAAWAWWRERRFPWRLCLLSGGILGGWLLFRVWYYADLLPNTFYLKSGIAWARGWTYLLDTILVYPLLPLLGAGAAAVAWLQRRGSSSALAAERGAMLAAAFAVALYVVRIGGAEIHYRYLAFPFCLSVCASAGVAEAALARAGSSGRRAGIALALGLLLWSAEGHPRQLDRHPLRPGVGNGARDQIIDAAFHRARIDFGGRGWSEQANPMRFAGAGGERGAFRYRAVETTGWCEDAYRRLDVKIVHGWGLTDALLARVRTAAARPGHKPRLPALAADLVALQRGEARFEPGVHRRWVEAGRAPTWVAANLAAIEQIERKVYNRHDLRENLGLAFRPVPRLELP
jgi:hypothetical protein